MTLATPTGPLGGSDPSLVQPVSVDRELAALRVAMDHARHAPAEPDDVELAFETFLAALTQAPQLRFGDGATSIPTRPGPAGWSSALAPVASTAPTVLPRAS